MLSSTEDRLRGLRILASLLRIHARNYPQFAYTVSWLDSHLLLADWLVPIELRKNLWRENSIDLFYVAYVANYLNVSYDETFKSFVKAYSNAPESQES